MARVFPGPQTQFKRPNPASNLLHFAHGATCLHRTIHLFTATNSHPNLSLQGSATDQANPHLHTSRPLGAMHFESALHLFAKPSHTSRINPRG